VSAPPSTLLRRHWPLPPFHNFNNTKSVAKIKEKKNLGWVLCNLEFYGSEREEKT